VTAALTEESVPHALRASVMLPFLLVLAVEGMILLLDLARRRRRQAMAITAVAVLVQGALFTVDMYATWPARSALDFDAGEILAIRYAATASNGTQVLLSSSLDQPYIQAAFALLPEPPRSVVDDSQAVLLAEMHMALVDPAALPAQPGAIAVLSSSDPVPQGSQRLFDGVTPAAPFSLGPAPRQYETVAVYRLR
jgi:hypothetical protein